MDDFSEIDTEIRAKRGVQNLDFAAKSPILQYGAVIIAVLLSASLTAKSRFCTPEDLPCQRALSCQEGAKWQQNPWRGQHTPNNSNKPK